MGRAAVAAIVSLWIVPVSILVNSIVQEPYMDEIFHIPQAQQYCRGNFRSWDPMITTPPGLLLFYEIFAMWRPAIDDRKATLYSVILALYPLQWFFTFLYYTDVASVAAVLGMYLASLKKNYCLSALVGAFAVIMRQTNIIWVLFVACTGVLDIIFTPQRDKANVNYIDAPLAKESQETSSYYASSASNLRKRIVTKAADDVEHSVPGAILATTEMQGSLDEIKVILSRAWSKKLELLVNFSPFVMVFAAFLAFVRWNGSIVLGAKEAHTVSLHFAQIMYFSLVSVLAMAPVHFTMGQAADLFKSFWKNKPLSFIICIAALVAGFISVHFFRSGRVQRRIWILVYFLATVAVLVPAPLIEFRYCTIPFYFLVLNSRITNDRSWLLMGLMYVLVNVFTMGMFLFRPFKWNHEPGIQRFIW
ncbi:hypothetical protein CDL15_Pgr020598 [Punica granatum]|uniref:Dol-P-Glc:Glc(2)Man(9)GlcNAc(2)-PP-Dol alpha-1,2-glucosyltransferase n=1 Tax=Punica granatum TaxID=22663 RepID=A0A218VXA8_PUNGR|nr:hypothetical protein CDL15_Pgr020598 [Punica granatum]